MARSQVLALPRPFGPGWVAGSHSGAASFADMDDDDATLVARTGAGDQLAFEQLVSRYERRLQRYLRSFVRDEEKAKELVQDTFVKVYKNAHRFEPRASFATWLFRIAHNVAVSSLRRKRLALVFGLGASDPESDRPASDFPSSELSPHQQAEGREIGRLLRQEVDRLPEKLREAFLLFDVEEMPIAEVARVTGSPEGTIKARIFRARRALRARLQGYVETGAAPGEPGTVLPERPAFNQGR